LTRKLVITLVIQPKESLTTTYHYVREFCFLVCAASRHKVSWGTAHKKASTKLGFVLCFLMLTLTNKMPGRGQPTLNQLLANILAIYQASVNWYLADISTENKNDPIEQGSMYGIFYVQIKNQLKIDLK